MSPHHYRASVVWMGCCIHSSRKWEIVMYWVTDQMQSRYLREDEKPFSGEINQPTCDCDQALLHSSLLFFLLFSPRAVREWCRLNFSAWYVHRLLSLCAWCRHWNRCVCFFPPSSDNYSVSTHRAHPQCVETRFLLYRAGGGKPLIAWEGNPWILCSEVITLRVDSRHLMRDCVNIA